MLYVPHLAILQMLGPRFGPSWARCMGRLHWLLSFLGVQREIRKTLENSHPCLRTNHSVSIIVRKHLELKHECFARLKLFNAPQTSAARSTLVWEVDQKSAKCFCEMNSSDKGLVLVGYHYGFFRLSATALPEIFPGCDAVHVSHRAAHYAGETFNAVAQLALRKTFMADQRSGVQIHYVAQDSSVIRLHRLLAAGGTVGMAADGVFAKDFLDVPFLGGKLRMPCGWARLAAATRSNVLILLDTELDRRRRRVWLFDHVQLHSDSSDEAIYRAVAESARILEGFVRREPWSWHPWQRLRREVANDGSPLLVLRELGHGRHDSDNSAGSDCIAAARRLQQRRHNHATE
jgi:Bacterial lipid A biosynthesis acyltransferase